MVSAKIFGMLKISNKFFLIFVVRKSKACVCVLIGSGLFWI